MHNNTGVCLLYTLKAEWKFSVRNTSQSAEHVDCVAAHITLFPVAVQRLTCVLGSCSGATVECTSVKSSLLMILKGRMRPNWSCWCLVCLHFNQSNYLRSQQPAGLVSAQ